MKSIAAVKLFQILLLCADFVLMFLCKRVVDAIVV